MVLYHNKLWVVVFWTGAGDIWSLGYVPWMIFYYYLTRNVLLTLSPLFLCLPNICQWIRRCLVSWEIYSHLIPPSQWICSPWNNLHTHIGLLCWLCHNVMGNCILTQSNVLLDRHYPRLFHRPSGGWLQKYSI